MTTLTTVLAMVTMIFSKDAGSEMGKGMAIVIVGGLSYATLMTLFIVPVMYDSVSSLTSFKRQRSPPHKAAEQKPDENEEGNTAMKPGYSASEREIAPVRSCPHLIARGVNPAAMKVLGKSRTKPGSARALQSMNTLPPSGRKLHGMALHRF